MPSNCEGAPEVFIGLTFRMCALMLRSGMRLLEGNIFYSCKITSPLSFVSVFENNSAHSKASVRNLRAKDVSLIAASPTIQLDHFDEIRKKPKKRNEKLKESIEKGENNQTNDHCLTDSINSTNLIGENYSNCLLNDVSIVTGSLNTKSNEIYNSDDITDSAIFEEVKKESPKLLHEHEINEISVSLADPRFQDPTIQESIVESYDPHNEDIEHESEIMISDPVDPEPKSLAIKKR